MVIHITKRLQNEFQWKFNQGGENLPKIREEKSSLKSGRRNPP
jgi:hypothetical protein